MTWATETAPAGYVAPTKKPSVSIVVPAFNEAGALAQTVHGICVEAQMAGLHYEIAIVNDGSADETGAVADRVALERFNVRAIHHSTNLGLRAAYETGLAAARHEYVTWVPADGEMATESIADILRAVGTADLVIPYHGTPERRTWFRRLLTWVSTAELNWLLGYDLHYFQGTVVYPTALARRLPRTVPGFFCMAEMLAYALDEELTYTQVPLAFVERTYGVSKAVSWRSIWHAQMAVTRIWWRLRVVTACQAIGFALEHR